MPVDATQIAVLEDLADRSMGIEGGETAGVPCRSTVLVHGWESGEEPACDVEEGPFFDPAPWRN
jgi:hypothetical protein